MKAQSLVPRRLADLAPETWMQVFEWACRDSGATGRSLGLVNQEFRRLSRLYAYQSIHLPRAKHILSFRELLSTLPADQKRVRFLHTPCPHIFMNALSLDDDDIEYDDEDEFEEDGHFQNVKEEPEESEVLRREAFRDILDQVSSSLLVLSVYWDSKFSVRLGELLIPLPRLEELHINTRFVDVRPNPQTILPPVFPNLRRLHFAGRYSGEHLPFDDCLTLIAPQLTHLYVPIFWLRTLNGKLQDSLRVIVVDMGPTITCSATDPPESYDQVASLVFGGHPVDGKTLTLIDDEDSEWLENIEGWEARWKLSNGARNRPPWVTW